MVLFTGRFTRCSSESGDKNVSVFPVLIKHTSHADSELWVKGISKDVSAEL